MAGGIVVSGLSLALSSCIWVHSPPPPTRDFYEPCTADGQCPVGTDCWSVTMAYEDILVTDSLCTTPCASDWDCPYDGVCQDPDGGPPLCYARCDDDYDCYDGFACVGGWFDAVCVPW